MFYLFARHAIRFPDGEDIVPMDNVLRDLRDKVVAAHEAGGTELCDEDVEELRRWSLNMVEADDNRVTPSGELETMQIGIVDERERFIFIRHISHRRCDGASSLLHSETLQSTLSGITRSVQN